MFAQVVGDGILEVSQTATIDKFTQHSAWRRSRTSVQGNGLPFETVATTLRPTPRRERGRTHAMTARGCSVRRRASTGSRLNGIDGRQTARTSVRRHECSYPGASACPQQVPKTRRSLPRSATRRHARGPPGSSPRRRSCRRRRRPRLPRCWSAAPAPEGAPINRAPGSTAAGGLFDFSKTEAEQTKTPGPAAMRTRLSTVFSLRRKCRML